MDKRKLECKNVVRPTERLTWASDVLLNGTAKYYDCITSQWVTQYIKRDRWKFSGPYWKHV